MIPIIGGMKSGMNKGAFRGKLTCPVCKSEAVRFLEYLNATRLRYRCRKCGLPFQYDISANMGAHPYAPFKKQKWQRIVESAKYREN